MKTYQSTIQYLYSLQRFGMKFGLNGIRRLLRSVGDPHKQFPSIHIAGTNGKGSTAAMLAAMLTAAGYKTGLYTSPHVVDFSERIWVDGRAIPREKVVRLVRRLRPVVQRHRMTFFETVTAVAFLYFAEQEVDIAIVETGLGGRFDATNVIRPALSIITKIGLEHTEILGRTIREIAFEKAGIMKTRVPCVTGSSSREAIHVFKRIARSRKSDFYQLSGVRYVVRSASLRETTADITIGVQRYKKIKISLPGEHQLKNAALALRAVEVINRKGQFSISSRAARRGLRNIQSLTGLKARLSVLQRDPLILADVAHNPDAMRTLVESLQRLHVEDALLVFGVAKDKDYIRMIRYLKPITDKAIVVAARTERSRQMWDLSRAFARDGILSIPKRTVDEGIQYAVGHARPSQPILVTGSHFVVGESLAYLNGKNYLTINQ